MTWSNITFPFKSQLSSLKLNQFVQNFSAMCDGDDGAPKFQRAAFASNVVHKEHLKKSSFQSTPSLPGGTPYFKSASGFDFGFFGFASDTTNNGYYICAYNNFSQNGSSSSDSIPTFALQGAGSANTTFKFEYISA